MPVVAPSGLTATAASPTQINLAWMKGQVYSAQYLERKEAGGSYAEIAVLVGSDGSYQDTTCQDGKQYYYRIRGEFLPELSSYSAEANATTPLPAPSGLSGYASSSTEIVINWNDNSQNETAFDIYIDGVDVADVGANVETYTAPWLSAGTWYAFKVRAKNAATTSDFSSTIYIYTSDPPSAPTGLTAQPTATTKVRLNWTDASTNETGFKIEKSIVSATAGFAQIGTVGAGVTTYEAESLTSNTQYWFRVRAYGDSGDSAYSNVATATTLAAIAQPTNLACTAAKVGGSFGVEAVFDDNSTGEDSHIIERGTGTFSGDAVTNGAFENWVSATQANDWTNVNPSGSTINRESSGPHGGTYCVRMDIDALGGVCLIGQAITLGPGAGQRVSFWYKTEAGKTATWLLREGGLGDAGVVSLGNDGLWYTIANGWQVLQTATAWTKVEIEFPAHSGYSTYTLWFGHAPGTSSATSSSIWFDDAKVEAGVFGTTVATLAPNRTYYHDATAAIGTAYRYRVRAKQGASTYSAYSNEVAITTPSVPDAPADLAVDAYQDEYIDISWTASAGAVGYAIEKSTTSGVAGFAEVLRVIPEVTSLRIPNLTKSTQYWIRVLAYNSAGSSSYSAVVTATTRAAYEKSTFERLISCANAPLVFLVEANPLMPLTGWALTSGKTYTYELAFGERGAVVDAIYENGVALAEAASAAAVESTSGSWYQDYYAGMLYVHPSTDGNPGDFHITGSFWMMFTTGPAATYNSNRYLPMVPGDGIPDIGQEIAPVYEGGISVSNGEVQFVNGYLKSAAGHFFDRIGERYIWLNRKVVIKAGRS